MATVHISIDIIKVISEKERMKKHLLLKTIAALMSCPKYKLSMKNKNMKKIYIHKIHLILCFTSVLCFGLPIDAQESDKNESGGGLVGVRVCLWVKISVFVVSVT